MSPVRPVRFENRADAGRQLAGRVVELRLDSPLVLGLPRGGIPVAAEVASVLGAPLEAFVARKVGAPGHKELGIGAVAEGLDEPVMSDVAAALRPGTKLLAASVEQSLRELRRQASLYRGDRPLPELADRYVVVVDDGLATGITAEAALIALRRRQPRGLVLAVPVCRAGRSGTAGADGRGHRLCPVAHRPLCRGLLVRGLLADHRPGGHRPAGQEPS